MKGVEPPDELSDRSEQLWRTVVPARIRTPDRLELLEQALRALDRVDEATEIILNEGLITLNPDRHVSHINPAVKVEKEAHRQFVRIWRKLGLDWHRGC